MPRRRQNRGQSKVRRRRQCQGHSKLSGWRETRGWQWGLCRSWGRGTREGLHRRCRRGWRGRSRRVVGIWKCSIACIPVNWLPATAVSICEYLRAIHPLAVHLVDSLRLSSRRIMKMGRDLGDETRCLSDETYQPLSNPGDKTPAVGETCM